MRDDDAMRDDAVRDLFVPLREPVQVDDHQVQAVLAAAARPARRKPRRRLVLAGISATVAVAASVIAITAVDQEHPGTFVGEAGARDLLSAAADATRDRPAPKGWRWSRTLSVQRMVLEGRRCNTCAIERAVLDVETATDVWSGPRGEAYRSTTSEPPRAIENAPLLRAAGALKLPPAAAKGYVARIPPAAPGKPTIIDDAGFGLPGTIVDPQAVPDTPEALIRWVQARLKARDRAQAVQVTMGFGMRGRMSPTTELNWTLIDLSTSLQLSGRQQAAAFEALAENPQVTVVDLPRAFAAPNRVAVRVPGAPDRSKGALPAAPGQVADRLLVFDRTTHRVVAEEIQRPAGNPSQSMHFGNDPRNRTLRTIDGGGSEDRFSPAVDVAGPGLDANGKRLIDPARATTSARDGASRRMHAEVAERLRKLLAQGGKPPGTGAAPAPGQAPRP